MRHPQAYRALLALAAVLSGPASLPAAEAWHAQVWGRDAFATCDQWYPFGVYPSRAAALRDLRATALRNRIAVRFDLSPLGPAELFFPPVEAPR